MKNKLLTFIGGGNMAQAIVFGLLNKGYSAAKLIVCDRNEAKRNLFAQKGVEVNLTNVEAAEKAEVVVLAVKPQAMAETCGPLSAVDFSGKLVISIAAAVSVSRLSALLPTAKNIVRVMPNTPALVSEGMAGLFASAGLNGEYQDFAEDLLNAVGKTCWLQKEEDMHAVTAGSGSSPAYFFLFMEAMEKTLSSMGISPENARTLVQQSALGAAKMVENNPQLPLSTLRENVTSKGGTTAAALAVFNQYQLDKIVQQAMEACVARSQEMEKLF
ncbi:pyrroline-5-carboxylate reductase [[Mannheimia] succiniciproducens]|uniref:Pyrroline-5-carboxylate reductase n=1 Tax=Mannheimia succiniciproducens (strain KCTC 0769BP / MBEL55E) TaxID=221988 RepID=Q65RK4_MANSM|nr:pyrroline-5-carboxylate reductase [[Mannheimia] succiniciproducens]AAU38406.1 ProC protein [[Mannheimia] succiniciproducens MBEL55E]